MTKTSDAHDLGGRTAIITGGGTGVGAATAMLFCRRGADVVIASRPDAIPLAPDSRLRAEAALPRRS